jgi:hypothetical protein
MISAPVWKQRIALRRFDRQPTEKFYVPPRWLFELVVAYAAMPRDRQQRGPPTFLVLDRAILNMASRAWLLSPFAASICPRPFKELAHRAKRLCFLGNNQDAFKQAVRLSKRPAKRSISSWPSSNRASSALSSLSVE